MSSAQYIQLIGTDRPGMEVTTIAALKLSNMYLREVAEELKLYTIPPNTKGIVEEINSANCRLSFTFTDKYTPGAQKTVFWIKRRDFDRFFSK